MCGHSLGPVAKRSKKRVLEALEAWEHQAVSAWNLSQWMELPQILSEKIATIIKCSSEDLAVCDSTSVNLFKAIMSALKLQNRRNVVLTTKDNFPADLYISQGIANFHPQVHVHAVPAESLMSSLTEDVAVLMLSHTNYRDASVLDMEKLSRAAHERGILVIWDLSHSIGIVPVDLSSVEIDFAVGCTYKYLSGGPGSPSFIYAHPRHQKSLESPISGWMGHKKPFEFNVNYIKGSGSQAYMSGTPSILSFAALRGALEVFEHIDIVSLSRDSEQLADSLIACIEKSEDISVISPKTGTRGGHVALTHPNGYALSRALIDHGIICDYREPDLVRLCVNPLHVDKQDIELCGSVFNSVLEKKTLMGGKYQQLQSVT
jgi:kynureninase